MDPQQRRADQAAVRAGVDAEQLRNSRAWDWLTGYIHTEIGALAAAGPAGGTASETALQIVGQLQAFHKVLNYPDWAVQEANRATERLERERDQ